MSWRVAFPFPPLRMPFPRRLPTAALATLSAAPLLATAAARAAAQDARAVTEPRFPAACATLPAALVAVGDSTLAAGDERRLDTERIQRAIDGCAAGRAVVLTGDGARRAFLSGPLQLRAGVTLRVDSGVTLYASRDPRVFDVTPGACGVLAPSGRGCRPLVSVERAPHAAVMGPGAVDGRGWATLLGADGRDTGVSWWDLAQRARNTKLNQNCPRLVVANRSDDFTLYRLTLRHSPNFHVTFGNAEGFTAWGVTINTPQPNARNTDGIDPGPARNVTITRSTILAGDDNVALKAGPGGVTNVTVSHNHFFRGHGMSIGSETNGGVDRVLVTDLSVDGADNGLRIKSNASRGGLVRNVTYEDVCIRRTKEPILMDTHYTASPDTTGTLIPQFTNIVLRNVRIADGGKITLDGYDASRPLYIDFDNVTLADPVRVVARHANVGRSGNTPDFVRSDTAAGVTVTDGLVPPHPLPPPNSCAGKFVPPPAR